MAPVYLLKRWQPEDKYLGCLVTPLLQLSDHNEVFGTQACVPPASSGSPRRQDEVQCEPIQNTRHAPLPARLEAGREAFRVNIRRHARAFLGIQSSSPYRIDEGLLGDLGPMTLDACRAFDSLLTAREHLKPPDHQLLKTQRGSTLDIRP
jgi:hypothetical protein